MLPDQDLVDQHLRERKETPAMQAVMGGTFAQQIICRSVNYRSEKEEDFYQVRCNAAFIVCLFNLFLVIANAGRIGG